MAKQRQYEEVSSEVEAWFRPEKDAVLEGRLIDFRFVETKFGDKILYLVSVTEPTMGVPVDSGEDEPPSEWEPGTTFGLFSSGGLGAMKRIRVGTQFRLVCTGERDIGRGNPMRTFKLSVDKNELGNGKSVESSPSSRANANKPSDDDIPF